MALEQSILKSTKKVLGLNDSYTEFDVDVISHINSSFFQLSHLGVGPETGFSIEDDSTVWTDFIPDSPSIHAIKTFVYLYVRNLFDPPTMSHHVKAIQDQITELKHQIQTERELSQWTLS